MIRVLLVNEVRLVGDTIAALLRGESDIEVVAAVSSLGEALARVSEGGCDVALVSATLPSDGTMRFVKALAGLECGVKSLVVGLTEAKWSILQYIEAGANGYVLEDDSAEQLLRRIRAAYRDRALVSPKIAAALMSRVAQLAQANVGTAVSLSTSSELTPRELEILELLADGLSNQQIAGSLIIEVGTVKNHVHSILKKLDVANRREAVACLPAVKTPVPEPQRPVSERRPSSPKPPHMSRHERHGWDGPQRTSSNFGHQTL
jgi:DNA-binding NarL/FixJ family response regulator